MWHEKDSSESSLYDIFTLFRGKKYCWESKIIAFNPTDYVEAPHIFISESNCIDHLDQKNVSDTMSLRKKHDIEVEDIIQQYNDLEMFPPNKSKIQSFILQQLLVTFLFERVCVVSISPFLIDVKHYYKTLRTDINLESDSRIFESSLQIEKPQLLLESVINRFGNPMGLVVGEQFHKDSDILKLIIVNKRNTIVANRNNDRLGEQILTIKNNLNNKTIIKSNANSNLKSGFYKFEGQDELLFYSLSFIHVSDFLLFQCVCKSWRHVLSYGLRTCNNLHIDIRGHYDNINNNHKVINNSNNSYNNNDSNNKNNKQNLVSSTTVNKLLTLSLRSLSKLHIKNCILDKESLGLFPHYSGRLTSLVIGNNVFIKNNKQTNNKNNNSSDKLRLINGSDVKSILVNCGSKIVELGVNIGINKFHRESFLYVPNLSNFILNGMADEQVVSCDLKTEYSGIVNLEEYTESMKGIDLPELLTLMSQSYNDDIVNSGVGHVLLDARGRIAIIDKGFEVMTGFSSSDVIKSNLSVIKGELTNVKELKKIIESYKQEYESSISTEATTYIYNNMGKCLLTQIICISSIITYSFMGALKQKYLDDAYIYKIALIQKENSNNDNDNKEYTYHLVRFASLSTPFHHL